MENTEVNPRCNIINCENEAKCRPVLLLSHYSRRGRSVTYSKAPVEMTLNMGLCVDHAKHATADQFIDENGWTSIEATLAKMGKALPTRHLTKLKFIQFDSCTLCQSMMIGSQCTNKVCPSGSSP